MFPIQLYWPGIHNSSSERGSNRGGSAFMGH